MSTIVSHVSDTARWVAVYRAQESARPDALFKDPLAEKLAGPRGQEIAANMPFFVRRNTWPMITRTIIIDELVLDCIAQGCDRVLNLAAGLDTRPYRLKLPASLPWIEADLPAMVEEKSKLLEGEKPVCALSREKVDLADASARGAFLDRALAGSKNALVITEGLLIYLDADTVRALGRDLHARGVRWWMFEISSPGILARMQRDTRRVLTDSATLRFGPAEGIGFFPPLGWKPATVRSLYREALKVKRLPLLLRLFSFFPDPPADNPGKNYWSAVVRCERSDAQ